MKITIEAENEQEREALAEPWIRQGIGTIGIAGFGGPQTLAPDGWVGFIHGEPRLAKAHVQRLIGDIDMIIGRQVAIDAALQAHNIIAQKMAQDMAVAQQLNGKPLRIVRP